MLYFDLEYEMIKTCRIDRIVSATVAEVVDDSVFKISIATSLSNTLKRWLCLY